MDLSLMGSFFSMASVNEQQPLHTDDPEIRGLMDRRMSPQFVERYYRGNESFVRRLKLERELEWHSGIFVFVFVQQPFVAFDLTLSTF